MSDPVRLAFCPILFGANGGQFDARGKPLFEEGVRGTCDMPFDCGQCPHMSRWLQVCVDQGWVVGWECQACLKNEEPQLGEDGNWEAFREERRRLRESRKIPGFYQSGRDPTLSPDDPAYDKDRPGLAGCTSCGFQSSLLQLVLRKPKGGS
jgi:hypothetical protein